MKRKKRGEEGTEQDRRGTEAGDRQEHGPEVGPNWRLEETEQRY